MLATLPWTEHVMALKLCLLHMYIQYSIFTKTILTSLLPSILNTFTQNTMHLFFASTLYTYYRHIRILHIASLDEKLSNHWCSQSHYTCTYPAHLLFSPEQCQPLTPPPPLPTPSTLSHFSPMPCTYVPLAPIPPLPSPTAGSPQVACTMPLSMVSTRAMWTT